MNDETKRLATAVSADLKYLGSLVNNDGTLPELPLHKYSPIEVTYYVLEKNRERGAAIFAHHAQGLQETATDQALRFTSEVTQITGVNRHHRATLHMPNGTVRFVLMWVEKPEYPDA